MSNGEMLSNQHWSCDMSTLFTHILWYSFCFRVEESNIKANMIDQFSYAVLVNKGIGHDTECLM